MDTCICMAEPLHSLPDTVATLLISYTPIQNKTFVFVFFFFKKQSTQKLGDEHAELVKGPRGVQAGVCCSCSPSCRPYKLRACSCGPELSCRTLLQDAQPQTPGFRVLVFQEQE